ncbi:exodeoxyribonuclease VII small subunit [Proteiniclasticum sp. SCR006]|uniref:Exodeoxyribonuclease 7 small subunit n=1 Tax=Proteiniclasticum aestuarii TaxID=2817862 RepID=A0A939H8N5_9CLOT|nr:exodeoxyribonuclease VII small subunit [Proteiniclasticum aestuarii]MBO1263531.1 exodeoxyribonuclease VII small subunit [Proteiniclasticum aestuarii]
MVKKKLTYKELTEKLDDIIENLESGELSVEESMEKYEEGVKITKELLAILNKAEEKVKIMRDQDEMEF